MAAQFAAVASLNNRGAAMKITFDRVKMLNAFTIASAVVPTRTPKAVLRNVRLQASGGVVTLLATDMELSVKQKLGGASVQRDGVCLLPADRFLGIVREASGDEMTIEAEGPYAIVKCGRSKFRLSTMPPDEFPNTADATYADFHVINAVGLKRSIDRTNFAVDMASSRYTLQGVLFEFSHDSLMCVASDGKRIAAMPCDAKQTGEHPKHSKTTIVPRRGTQILSKTLGSLEGDVKVHASENDIVVFNDDVSIRVRLAEGVFPKWRMAVPSESEIVINVVAGNLVKGIKQAAVVVSEESKAVTFAFESNTLTLTAETAEVGDSHVEVEVEHDGKPVRPMLDPRFVSEFLNAIESDRVFALHMTDDDSASVFRVDDGYLYVLMPMSRQPA